MDEIKVIEQEFDTELQNVKDTKQLDEIRVSYLGKKGKVTNAMSKIRDIVAEKRKEFGQSINQIKNKIEDALASLKEKLENEKIQREIANEKVIDITLPTNDKKGSLHPRTTLAKEIEDVFVSMGFTVEDGNEIETEYNNFDAVNVPKNHPARDMQDTFWLDNGELLKTQTSAAQNKILRKYNGPLKAIFPGRCFRNEALDHSHENTFFQIEGMLVDKNVSVANLIYFMKKMLSEVFKTDINIRLRPGFFPFVEPGFEMDATCTFCGGKGCPTCKNSGWLELCPCGMIHPNVFKLAGYDPNEYSGFAFGLGFDRLVMLKTGLDDIRYLNSGNLKVLSQFGVKA
ncbi:MAG: phenylalanine--tRNA ligase subunit alpha [Eubacteriales bacterium]|nr:phenylalanine--tRNA ligase subunit alpha [Eubacteriales bacterium]